MKKILTILAITTAIPGAALANSDAPLDLDPAPIFEYTEPKGPKRLSIGVSESFLGHTVEGSYRFTNNLALRGMYGTGDFSFSGDIEGNNFDGDVELGGYGLLLDYYIGESSWRLSGGALKLDHSFSATTNGSANINGISYPTNLSVDASFKNDIAPVASIGFQKPLFGSNIYLSGDLGAVYTGGVNVSATESSGLVPQSEIDAEIGEISDALGKLKVAPFISIGVGVSF